MDFHQNLASFLLVMTLTWTQGQGHTCSPTSCPSSSSPIFAHLPANTSSDFLYIGGVFPVHQPGDSPYECGEINDEGLQQAEAFLWAVQNFHQRKPGALQTASIGAFVIDSCGSSDRITQLVLGFETCQVGYADPPIEPFRVMGYVGLGRSAQALDTAHMFSEMDKTVVVSSATASGLGSPTSAYSQTLRTVPSDNSMFDAIIQALQKQEWTSVQAVIGDDQLSQDRLEELSELLTANNISMEDSIILPHNPTASQASDAAESLNDVTVPVILLVKDDEAVYKMLSYLPDSSTIRFFGEWSPLYSTDLVRLSHMEGSVFLEVQDVGHYREDFTTYFESLDPSTIDHNPWIQEYWDKYTGDVSDVDMDLYVPYTLLAVDTILLGAEQAREDACGAGDKKLCSRFMAVDDVEWQRKEEATRQVKFVGVDFDEITGDNTLGSYTVINVRPPDNQNCGTTCYEPIGEYDLTGQKLQLTSSIEPPVTETTTTPPPSTSSVAVTDSGQGSSTPGGIGPNPTPGPEMEWRDRMDETWIIVLIVLTSLGLAIVVLLEIYLMYKMVNSPYVKNWRTMWLGQLLLLAVFLSYLTLFAFVPDQTKHTCGIIRFGVGGCYAMIFAVLLVKLMIILSSETLGYLQGIYQVLMFIFAWGVQIALDTEWLILVRPSVKLRQDNDTMIQEMVCGEDFDTHLLTLVYVAFLILVCTLLSVRTHGLVANHREGIFVGLSCGATIPIWLTWTLLPVLKDDTDYEEPCMAFGLLATATLVLFIMFLPKVRQLNNMGMDGVYAEDDHTTPDYTASILPPSIVPAGSQVIPAGSIITNNVKYATSQKGDGGSLLYVDGTIHESIQDRPPSNVRYEYDPAALYLKHPGQSSTDGPISTESVRSAPATRYIIQQPSSQAKVLRVTHDLVGRMPADKRSASEQNLNVQYATTPDHYSTGPGHYGTAPRSTRGRLTSAGSTSGRADSHFGTFKPSSIRDLGSL